MIGWPAEWLYPRERLRNRLGGRVISTGAVEGAEETVTVYRGMWRSEFEAIKKSGELTSKGRLLEAQGTGVAAEEGLASRILHSWRWSKLGPPPNTPYVSTSMLSKVSGGYAQGADRVVVKLVMRRADMLKGLNPHQAEYLFRTGAKVAEYSEMSAGALSWGPRGALIRAGVETGVAVAPAAVGGVWVGTKVNEIVAGDQ